MSNKLVYNIAFLAFILTTIYAIITDNINGVWSCAFAAIMLIGYICDSTPKG